MGQTPRMSKTRRTSNGAFKLLQHHRLHGRAYPKPRHWERLFQVLDEEAERRGRTPPPTPLVDGLDHASTLEDRMRRLDEQVFWADRNALLHKVTAFFDALPPLGWQMRDK